MILEPVVWFFLVLRLIFCLVKEDVLIGGVFDMGWIKAIGIN